jgi:hypothetical protein
MSYMQKNTGPYKRNQIYELTCHAGLASRSGRSGARVLDEIVAYVPVADIFNLGSKLLHLHGHTAPV